MTHSLANLFLKPIAYDVDRARVLLNALQFRISHNANKRAIYHLQHIPMYKEYLEAQANIVDIEARLDDSNSEWLTKELEDILEITEDEVSSFRKTFNAEKNRQVNIFMTKIVTDKIRTHNFLKAIVDGDKAFST